MKKYGFYSQEAAPECGTVFYATPDGKEVEVTNVGSTQDPKDSGYLWEDAVCVGEITEYTRKGQEGTTERKIIQKLPDPYRFKNGFMSYGELRNSLNGKE